MTTAHPATPLEGQRDFTEQRDWGIRFVIVAGLAAWLLSGAFGSSGGGGGESGPSWSVVIQVMPSVHGAVVGMIALAWIVTQWERHDREFVMRVRRLVLLTAWTLVAVAIVGSYAALFFVDRPPASPPVVFFPLQLVDVSG